VIITSWNNDQTPTFFEEKKHSHARANVYWAEVLRKGGMNLSEDAPVCKENDDTTERERRERSK